MTEMLLESDIINSFRESFAVDIGDQPGIRPRSDIVDHYVTPRACCAYRLVWAGGVIARLARTVVLLQLGASTFQAELRREAIDSLPTSTNGHFNFNPPHLQRDLPRARATVLII